jgi:mannose-6-phosphate isomerase-like protein (cupin superfamily)
MRERIRHLQPEAEYYFVEGCYINELANSAEDEAVSIARARVAPGVATRWHRLHGIVERYVILSGMGRVEVGELPAQDVVAGTTVLIPAQCRQRITNTGTEDLVFLAICSPRFRPEAYEDLAS